MLFTTNIYYILIGITFYSLYFVVETFTHCLNLENDHKIVPDPGLLVSKPLCVLGGVGRVVQGGVLSFALFCNEQEIKTAVLSMQRTLSKREWHAHEHGQIWLLQNTRGTEITFM